MSNEYAGKRICGVEDHLGASGQVCRWPTNVVRYHIVHDSSPFSPENLSVEYAAVLAKISAKCGLTFVPVAVAQQANIIVTFGQIDGPMKTLAWSELPCGNVSHVTQRYDISEAFVMAINPPSNKVGFPLVALHETLHALGVPHLSGGLAVMNPVYNPNCTELQPLDVAELITRYGPPVPPTTPTPPVPPTGDLTELIAFLKDSQGRPVIRIGGTLFGAG